jgi:hypothetical protein
MPTNVILCLIKHVVDEAKVISKMHHLQELAKSDSVQIMLQKLGQTCSLLQYFAKDKLPKVYYYYTYTCQIFPFNFLLATYIKV